MQNPDSFVVDGSEALPLADVGQADRSDLQVAGESSGARFLAENQDMLAELVTFVDFAEGLTIGFVEINFAADGTALLGALRANPIGADIEFVGVDLAQQPDLRFLRDELMARLAAIPPIAGQKRVVVVRGLEAAIGTDGVGAYPPVLQDLNFMRDAYQQSVPHPLLFLLPDYAITRVAKYAPDFWAWRSGVFRFHASAVTRAAVEAEAFAAPTTYIASPDNQAQIDRLQTLLMEYRPSGQPIAPANLARCADLYYKLGLAYLTQHQPARARDHLQQALELAMQRQDDTLVQSIHSKLGDAHRALRQFEPAHAAYTQALELAQAAHQPTQVATTLFKLGNLALDQRQFLQARDLYQQCLEIEDKQGDRQAQASTYHQLGNVAEAQREYAEARESYQQALQIYVEFNDRYSQAGTYHQLGNVAEAQREYAEARESYQQALQIYVEFNDRYSQAGTYGQLGLLAEAEENYAEARACLQQALALFTEFGDEHYVAMTQQNLDRLPS